MRNVVGHAGANRVAITLSRPDHRAVLEVSDDGIGFDPATGPGRPGHVGLRVLTERAVDAGGSVEVTSHPGQGTRVHLEVPTR